MSSYSKRILTISLSANIWKFKMAAGKTLKSILISCGARLAPFDIQAVREMMEYDELELEKLGDEKIALFAVVSDSDPTFNFISAMMYSQMFNVLCKSGADRLSWAAAGSCDLPF